VKNPKRQIGIIAAVLVAIILISGAYTVEEGTQVIVTQFGRPVGDPVTKAGLHFKLPFFQDVRVFERRVLEWDGDPNQIPTFDKRFIEIDTTARWRIADPLLFLRTVQDERGGQGRLDDILDSETRDAISSHNLIEAVRSTNREMAQDAVLEEIGEVTSAIEAEDPGAVRAGEEKIDVGRGGIVTRIFENCASQVGQYGIELVDFRIKKINYVEDVRLKVYDRMISERKKIAERYRSEGRGRKAEIDGQREKELLRIRSEAYRREQEIIGAAEAESTRLYAEAYGQDSEFFAFLATLDAYREMLDEAATLVLPLEGELLQYLISSEFPGSE
jgi:membrane protease subunit HflC